MPAHVFLTNSMAENLYNKQEKGDAMYYEIYIDSLFLVNFVMNLYLLLLVNESVCRTATRLRLILGAAVGAVMYLLPFFIGGYVWLKIAIGMLAGTCLMIFTAFPVKTLQALGQITARLLLLSFLMGGGILFLMQRIPFIRQHFQGIFGVMGAGALVFLLTAYLQERKNGKSHVCRVTLSGKDGKMKVAALVDSGNSLVEPISGKPVSVIDKNVFHGLWKEPPEFYRVIPYHSIGKKRGMLKGYLLPEIQIEVDGVTKNCRDVYIAVSEESITGESISLSEDMDKRETRIKMIVNPVLLKC